MKYLIKILGGYVRTSGDGFTLVIHPDKASIFTEKTASEFCNKYITNKYNYKLIEVN